MSVPNPREVITTKALTVWIAAMLVYIMAIAGRTSFGVAGLEAIHRFQVDASQIAVFATVQLGVYALAQIPTGILIDKFGPRRLLVIGAVIMGLGQVVLGLTTNYWVALGARVLIGAGDATAFLSVMRILPYWFPLHRTPMFTQVTSSLGQVGQFLSALPFSLLLGWSGWTVAFVTLGAVVVLVALAAAVAVSDSPEDAGILRPVKEQPNARARSLRHDLGLVLRSPVAWQAFFIHYVGLGLPNVFILMWGIPLLTQGMGWPKAHAGLVLTWFSVCMVIVGPLHGKLSSRARGQRAWLAVILTAIHVLAWVLFYAFGTSGWVPTLLLVMVMALCSPCANYGFDIVRENLDRTVVATATGLGNMGGFVSSMLGAQLFGIVLSHVGSDPHFTLANFRTASWAVAAVWVVGIAGILATQALRRRSGGTGPHVTIVDVR